MTDPSGAVVLAGRYRLRDRIASGGMGEVWRADDLVLDRPVAVKVLHAHLAGDPDLVARFRREALAAARLQHPGIVAVHDTVGDGEVEAIVLQLIDGPTLRHYLDRAGTLSDDQTITIGVAVAEALAAAHHAGIIHRDVKPANILFGPHQAMVTDFGIAKALDETDHTASGTLLGSARYLSPEQVAGRSPDGRSDVFSLGVVLFECRVGSTPWQGTTPAATALARLERPAPAVADVAPGTSPALASVIDACLAIDPAGRPGSAADVAAALQRARREPTTAIGFGAPARHSDPTDALDVNPAVTADADLTVPVDVDLRADPFDGTEQLTWAPGVVPEVAAPIDDGSGATDDDDDYDDGRRSARRRSCLGPLVAWLVVVAAIAVLVALLTESGAVRNLFGS